MGTWNSISGLFQSGNGVSGGNKKLCFFQLLKKIRDFNLSPFREIEPDQVKKVCLQLVERKKIDAELGFEPVSQKFCGALRAC